MAVDADPQRDFPALPSYEIGSLAQAFEVARTTEDVANASEKLNSTIQQITANSEETSAQADVVSSAAQPASQNLQTVATGAEEMGASIQEIAKSATEAAKVATSLHPLSRWPRTRSPPYPNLGDSSNQFGRVIKVISPLRSRRTSSH
jgi:methyl-accepting chemotaxis protein